MMSFCKSVHSFLGLANHPPINLVSFDQQKSSYCNDTSSNINLIQGSGGLGLMSATSDICKTPNVLESSSLKSTPASSPPSPSSLYCSSNNYDFLANKKDPGSGKIGFVDDIGGGVDGLMSCTESLGCESSDERRVDDEIELCLGQRETRSRSSYKWRFRDGGERSSREEKKFPPPLSSLNQNGQPNFFLKPVRKDGRLELTEVRIDRPEVLLASRQDGRLRLHLVRQEEEEEEEFDVKEEEGEMEEEKKELVEEEKQEEEQKNEEIKESIIDQEEEWGFLEGLRRCHHNNNHHHNHNNLHNNHHHKLHIWSQQCVSTR